MNCTERVLEIVKDYQLVGVGVLDQVQLIKTLAMYNFFE